MAPLAEDGGSQETQCECSYFWIPSTTQWASSDRGFLKNTIIICCISGAQKKNEIRVGYLKRGYIECGLIF